MFSVALLALLIVQTATGAHSYVLKRLNLQTVEQIKSELVASHRMLQVNKTPDEYDEAIIDRELIKQLTNKTIRVLAKKVFPYICFHELGDGQRKLSCFVGDIWNTLEEHLGFRTKLIADMKNGRLWDILLNPRELSLKQLARYSYTFPIAKIWYHLFAKGSLNSSNFVAYWHIFDRKLWAVILIVSLVLSISLWGAWKVRRKALEFGRSKHVSYNETTSDMNYSTCMLSVLGCMINQGSQFKTENNCSIRIITLLCILLGLIITTSFSALLISKLATVGDVSSEKLDLESLAAAPRGRSLCAATLGYAYKRVSLHDVPHYLQRSTLKINGWPCTPGDHDVVPSQDYCADRAVVLETIPNAAHALSANPFNNPDSCAVYIYHKKYFNSYLILVARKHFPYLRIINKYLLRMEESGLAKKLNEAWQPSQTEDHRRNMDQDSKARSKLKVSFYHIKSIFMVYLGAAAVSLVILGMERLYKWLYDS